MGIIIIKIFFWFFLIIVFYSYIGYGLLLYILVQLKGKRTLPLNDFKPPVTLVIAAFNEKDFIRKKIENTLSLNYPPGLINVIFVSDGSTDGTPDIIRAYPQVRLLHENQRKGKVAAINRAMQFVTTPYVIFCDANTLLNNESITRMMRHYQDETVGGVAGEKKVIDPDGITAAGVGEGAYWKYESVLKKLDAQFYTVVGAAGELFSVRTALFEPVPETVLLDDFIISLKICERGYRIEYEPGAFAMESPSDSMRDEQKRKVRISAGGFQAMYLLRGLLNIFRYPMLSFQYISHRVLRWTACPLFLPFILIFNIILVLANAGQAYQIILLMQVFFYCFALLGWIFATRNLKVKLFYIPYYFLFMNVSLYLGFIRFVSKKQSVLWEKASRKNDITTKVV